MFALVFKILLGIITALSSAVRYEQPCEASTSVGIIELPSGVQSTGCSGAIALPEEIKN
jgi:hypothetical protein